MCECEAHREGKVRIVLEENGHGSAEVRQSEGLDVTVINKDSALRRVVDAGNEFQDCAFSRAVHPDNDLKAW